MSQGFGYEILYGGWKMPCTALEPQAECTVAGAGVGTSFPDTAIRQRGAFSSSPCSSEAFWTSTQ